MQLKARRAAVVFIVIMIILIVLLVILRSMANRVYESYEVIGTVDWTPTAGVTIVPYGNDFISYSPDGIHCTNAAGKDIWSFSYVMQEPRVSVKGDYVAVADLAGRNIYIYDKTGLIGEISTSSPVQNIRLSAGGVVAAVLDDVTTSPIHLYYHDGSEISYFRTTMSRSGYPTAIGISDSGKLVAVSYTFVDNAEMTSHVAFYNFGEVGKNETDNLVSAYDYTGEIVPMVEFMSEEYAFAVANDRLMLYEGSQRPTNTANVFLQDEVRAVYYGEEYLGLVYFDKDGESRYRMDVYDRKGRAVSDIRFDVDYTDIRFAGDKILIYNPAECVIYTVKGRLRYSGGFNDPVRLMLPGRIANRYTLVTNVGLQTIELK